MWLKRSRMISLIVCFIIGLLSFFLFTMLMSRLLLKKTPGRVLIETRRKSDAACAGNFSSPDEILSALQSADVDVRREMHRRLFLQPGITTSFYDYERDWNYPARAEHGKIRYPNLDDTPEPEALITFVRYESPVALVLKRGACGWQAVAALSAWLRYEDYPYDDWLELVETVKPDQQQLLIRDSDGDATRYVRKARLLKLMNNSLEEVARYDEETITPLENYKGADWESVKKREMRRAEFAPANGDAPARLTLRVATEALKYSGVAPSQTFWRETDGAWHTAREHWRMRKSLSVGRAPASETETFVWDEGKQRFIPAEQSR